MRRVTALLVAAAVAGLVATTFAQGTNFSGTWVAEAPAGGGGGAAGGGGGAAGGGGGQRGGGRGGMGGGGGFNCGNECTIVQDAKTLTIKRPAPAQGGNAPADVVFQLTGVSKIAQAGRGGAEPPPPVDVTAKWDGAKWVLTRSVTMGENSMTVTQTIALDGGKLTVTTNTGMPDAQPTTRTYTKK